MMKSYTAYCMNEDGENMCMTREYNSKKDFMSDLHGNGYKVHFIALTDKYDEECAKYYERLEHKRRISAIRRECEREWRERDKAFEKELEKRLTAEDQAAEVQATEDQATEDQATEDQATENQATEEQKNYYAESYNFGFIAHNSEYGAPSLLIFSNKEDREKYINKYDIYCGDVNKRVIAITAKEARKYYERTRDGVRGWKEGTEYIKHIRDNIYYSVESGDYGRTSEEFTL